MEIWTPRLNKYWQNWIISPGRGENKQHMFQTKTAHIYINIYSVGPQNHEKLRC